MDKSVLYITPFFPPFDVGGMELSLKLLAETMAQNGWQVQIVTPGYGLDKVKKEGKNPEIIYLPWEKTQTPRVLFSPGAYKKFTAGVEEHCRKPSLIDAYAWPQPGVILKRRWRVPLVVSLRDASFITDLRAQAVPQRLSPLLYFKERFRVYGFSPLQIAYGLYGLWRNSTTWKALKQADHLTYASEALSSLFKEVGRPGSAIYSIVGVEKKSLPQVEIPGRDPKLPLIVYAGRLAKGKGAGFLFDTVEQLLDSGLACQCAFIGRGDLEKDLRASRHPKNILVLGRKTREETIAVMQAADLTVVPSLIFEAFPRSAIESIAVGTPVIGTTVGGIPEAVGEHGQLVPPGNTVALAHAIRELLEDPKKRAALTKQAAQSSQFYSAEAMFQRVEPIYQQLSTPQ